MPLGPALEIPVQRRLTDPTQKAPQSIIPVAQLNTPVDSPLDLSRSSTNTSTPATQGSSAASAASRPGVGSRKPSYQDPAAESKNSAEEFFYKHSRRRNTNVGGIPDFAGNAGETFNESILNEKVASSIGSGFIQPRARNVHQPKSTVIDKKKKLDSDYGLPSLKINRSSNNLSSLGKSTASSSTNLASLNSLSSTNVGALRGTANAGSNNQFKRSGGSSSGGTSGGAFSGFMLNQNQSSSSLTEHPEEESAVDVSFEDGVKEIDADDWSNNFNDMIHGRAASKLAPFGGFSNPDVEAGLLAEVNIFETAPWKVVFTDKGNVSLTKAVKTSFESGIISKRKWVGTIAMPSDSVSDRVIGNIADELSEDYNCEAVFPDDETFHGHYKSYCKEILWPTLHYQVPDDPKSRAFEAHSWDQYKALNQMVADKVVEVYKKEHGEASDAADPNNMIWVHDYHLLLVPQMIRDQLPNARIGFFLHVSFPSSEIFRVFAERKELLQGMLGANCVSMQTDEYVRHFLQTCLRLLLADTNEIGISYNSKYTVVNTIPVGIDVPSLEGLIASEEVLEWRQMIRERWGGQKLLVLRDKVDKLRGIKQKLLAYEMFLKDNPSFVDKTVLIQICMGSVQDSDYEAEILQIVSRINSLAENISVSQPVILLQQDIDFEQYLALLCELDVFVVSSMREGLNLTCHEFVTCQREKKSPLVLSEFTGSSPLLDCNGRGALLINPWDLHRLSATLKQLLQMDSDEKKERWENCYEIVLEHDSKNWVRNCLKSIEEAWLYDQRKTSNNIETFNKEVLNKFYNKYGNSGDNRRLIFLNLETPLAISSIYDSSSASNATPAVGKTDTFSEPSRILKLLNDLLSDESNHVYLISFLKKSDLDILYRTSPNLGLIAENGGYIKLIGSKSWISIGDEKELTSWMPQVKQLIDSKVVRLPGSHIEVEDCTIRFHPGRAFLENRERSLDVMGDCIQHINELFQELEGIHASLIRNVVIVQQNHLTLKAFKFVLSFYNNESFDEFKLKKVPSRPNTAMSTSNSTASIISLDGNKPEGSKIKSIFVGGGSTLIDEPTFEYANDLKADGVIDNVLTVAVLGSDANSRTSANYGVLGKNVLLSVLSKVKELKE